MISPIGPVTVPPDMNQRYRYAGLALDRMETLPSLEFQR